MMNIERFIFNPFAENTYVVWDETGECVIVDAGNFNAADNRKLEDFIESRGLRPVLAVNTHGHFDHLLGVPWVVERWGVEWLLPAEDRFLVDDAPAQAQLFGVSTQGAAAIPSRDFSDEVRFGNSVLKVIHTPGHTPGHVCLHGGDILLTGDTLFKESIGRTDLPGGDYSWIMRSIIERLLPIGGDVAIYPGHGADSTLGHEALYNPFVTEVLNSMRN